jgi:predicted transcriptional regulator
MSYDKQERMSALEESDEVFNAKMQKGLDDMRNGRVTPLDDVYAELSKAIS